LTVRPARRATAFWATFVVLDLALLAAALIPIPYYALGPGPAREVRPLIRVSDVQTYPSAGRFVMTSVHFEQVTAVSAVLAWLDPHRSVVPRSDLYSPGETDQQEQQRATSDMDQSKLDAAYVVLRELEGYPKDSGAGAVVEGTVSGCAADGELFPGDLITAIDGTATPTVRAASRLIEEASPGSTLTFDVTVDGTPQHIDLVRRPCGSDREPLVGVSLIPRFPFPIDISSGDIGGPSAGLMWAVTLYDMLTPGDLTGGRTIAGTGEIGLDGTVYPIGGIQDKIVAAKDAGASVLLLPKGNLAEARASGVDGIRLVPVETFDEAVSWLRGNA
jgi:PDZ domain-containing protein